VTRSVFRGLPHRLVLSFLALRMVAGGSCPGLAREPAQRITAIQLPTGMDPHYYSDVAFSPDGKTLALAKEENGTVELWGLTTRKKEVLPSAVRDKVGGCTLSFSRSGRLLAGAYADRITVWEIAMGKVAARLPLESGGNLTFTDGDRTFFALAVPKDHVPTGRGYNPQIVRFDVASGKRTSSADLGLNTISPLVARDGRYAAIEVIEWRPAYKDTWGIYDLTTSAKIADLTCADSFVFSGDGATLVSFRRNRLSVMRVPSAQELRRFELDPPAVQGDSICLSLSFDGKLLAAGRYPDKNTAGVISLESGKLVGAVECGPKLTICRQVWLSPDGRALATMTYGVNIKDQPVPALFKLWKVSLTR
jgi:WD40 repeat protein